MYLQIISALSTRPCWPQGIKANSCWRCKKASAPTGGGIEFVCIACAAQLPAFSHISTVRGLHSNRNEKDD